MSDSSHLTFAYNNFVQYMEEIRAGFCWSLVLAQTPAPLLAGNGNVSIYTGLTERRKTRREEREVAIMSLLADRYAQHIQVHANCSHTTAQ